LDREVRRNNLTGGVKVELKNGFKTSEFWVTIVTALVVFLNNKIGIGLSEGDVKSLVTVVLGYVASRAAAKLKVK